MTTEVEVMGWRTALVVATAGVCAQCGGRGTICSCGDTRHVPCQGSHFAVPCAECAVAKPAEVP